MWTFTIRRILIMIPQLFVLSVVIFFLAKMMPGDALTGLIDPNIGPEAIERQRERLGLNNPWYVQYFDWITKALQGDLGQSFRFKLPVTELIEQRMWNSVWLSVVTLIFTYLIAIPLGVISGRYNDTIADRTITTYTYIGFAAPLFIFALVMLFIFGFKLQWFPTGGSVAPGLTPGTFDYFLSKLYHLMLPALSMALITTVSTVQYLRSEIIDIKHKEFILTARSKGASESRVYNRHIFRNSLLPIAAFFGYEITFLIGGSVFIENIFSYPGMGELFISSITQRDTSVVAALVLLFGIASILGALISDIILSIIDPRIRIK
ncbi:peptide ABC transporter permease [Alkalihalobacillus alcalophilus ATCC 27647 = CGMCC 1.3604]|uniref:Dipeptide/oligopeptide transporter n=1 Tax=Alkalihalobacillus alcalophilus ATCC 27647 = CGMCC 1.3604 TaxID=1218173 RepID=J8TV80_ALKAL|nr:oligopeptide ABC transporter permease [Alkalihalobacillus alcalophilus]AFV25678.1 dipeptide/oligopeptide transporter [Alkalihalobacillus alcalophilus ATCC 27647 = CGMCC 1.3604]KGA96527.1 peptide ABC transporter permease [Alkalihalobacillus alcalophilus ATCC 27647 = CGMCC 1.3604]MED1561685.1 ABC transporter permease [Alkalihalobacillus alcalophilus]THG90919.1 peptide ABC transporter permease [Alkalihalobacillus alcalophilus ATCC 27647 = CGMCC 1.3604]